MVAAGQALGQQFQAQASLAWDTLARRGLEKTMGPSLTWQWDEPPTCQFYSTAKIHKSYFHSCTFVWGSPSQGIEMS